jgi:hypothetical protein
MAKSFGFIAMPAGRGRQRRQRRGKKLGIWDFIDFFSIIQTDDIYHRALNRDSRAEDQSFSLRISFHCGYHAHGAITHASPFAWVTVRRDEV